MTGPDLSAGMTGLDVRDILPHRYPMLLVDRVVDLVPGERITALKAVSNNEPWYAGADLDPATATELAYPPVLLMESWAQAAGILANAQAANPDVLTGQVMLFGGATEIQFIGAAYPGDVLEHRVRVVRLLTDTAIFDGDSRVGDRVVLTVERMVMAFRPAAGLRPADQRR